ncbi:WD40 repeat domain-containing serine/threonine protein kinase [Paludisphaera mucosa]|uniref:Protein kinase n=1 Tax=Paludisphaera mucosa TaxID=3030827 RepID=A0ABT6F8M8_9BACT|nr:protein kinase [Paludisphaera mucosa]MDG3003730.1 protein kinase [Paludisphaera mucosa]
MPPEPPYDRDEGSATPTMVEGAPLGDWSHELGERDLAHIREILQRIDQEASRSIPTTPTTLAALGPYRDLVEIGRGGMGVVYRAVDPDTGEVVAVKTPSPGLMIIPAARRRFRCEAEVVSSLNHPGVVPHRGSFEDDGRCYIVSDYCDGPDLDAWLKARKAPIPPREAARIVRELADAIAHAHDRNVLHRDVKPSNVLLPGSRLISDAEELSPRLTDFGLAKLIDDGRSLVEAATATGLLLGSPPYMAPEQASGRRKDIDRRTDVYGLGAVLYELLTARPPFRGENPAETIRMVQADDPIPVRVLRPGVPRALETIALQCLEKSPDRRYQTADDLRDDLDRFLAGRPILAKPIGTIERLQRWSRRRPKLSAVLASVLVGTLLVISVIVAMNHSLRRERDRADQSTYASKVPLARRTLDAGQLGRAQLILRGLIPERGQTDRREFSWYFLQALAGSEARMLPGHALGLGNAALSPDQGRMASGNLGRTLEVYDLQADRVVWSESIPGLGLTARPAFSPDGRLLAFPLAAWDVSRAAASHRIEVRSADTGAILARRPVPGTREVLSVHFLDDDRLAVLLPTGGPEGPSTAEVHYWSSRQGLPEFAAPVEFAAHRATSPDGRLFAAVDAAGRLGIYDVTLRTWRPPFPEVAPWAALYVGFAEDGQRLAVARADQRDLMIFDVATGRPLRRLPGLASEILEVAFQPGGEAILVRDGSQEVRLIDPARGVDVQVFAPTEQPGVATSRMRFTPAGDAFLIHRSAYQGTDHIQVRSSLDGRILGESPGRYKAHGGDWLIRRSDPPVLIYGLGRLAWRWDWSSTIDGRPAERFQAHADEIWKVAYSPSGSILATAANNDHDRHTIKLWEVPSNRPIRSWEDLDSTASDLAFAPDSSWIATTHFEKRRALRIRPTRGEGPPTYVELPDGEWGRAVDVDPAGLLVYVGGDRGTVLAWDVSRGATAWELHPPPDPPGVKSRVRIHDLVVAPGGRRLAVVDDEGKVRIRDAATGELVASYQGPAPMFAAAYSPDGDTLAAADQEGAIHLLDARTLRPTRVITGDDCDLRALAFSPDGRTLAAGGVGRIVRLLDPFTGEELLALGGHEAQINSITFSPDGTTMVSGDHSGTIRFWRGPRASRPASRTASARPPGLHHQIVEHALVVE